MDYGCFTEVVDTGASKNDYWECIWTLPLHVIYLRIMPRKLRGSRKLVKYEMMIRGGQLWACPCCLSGCGQHAFVFPSLYPDVRPSDVWCLSASVNRWTPRISPPEWWGSRLSPSTSIFLAHFFPSSLDTKVTAAVRSALNAVHNGWQPGDRRWDGTSAEMFVCFLIQNLCKSIRYLHHKSWQTHHSTYTDMYSKSAIWTNVKTFKSCDFQPPGVFEEVFWGT